MDFNALGKALGDVTGQNIYLQCLPEVLDFTDKEAKPELKIFAQGGKEFSMLLTAESLPLVVNMLKFSVFAKGMKILAWNWKNLASYILGKTGKLYSVDGAIIDLKIIESYAGRKLKAPKNLVEAMNRLKDLITTGIWKEIEPVYKNLHMPLMTTVIPHLETAGIMDTELGNRVYAYYEIDGQENGRLRCSGAFKQSYIPHVLKPRDRAVLKPRSHDELFMLFDFRANEVFVLAWASQDPLLLELCKERDVYTALYEKLFGKKAEGKNDRDLGKKCFLPVIYGQSAYGLSQATGIAPDAAERIVSRIDTLFPVAVAFVEGYQRQLQETGYAKDIFGKRRTHFEEGKEYSVRNFSVQSPAAIVCLEKLTHLYFALKDKTDLAFTVHDGYAVYASKENWKTVFKVCHEVLSGESQFCPGLRLKVTCRAGRNLDSLKSLERPGDKC